ncbi:NAD+ synthase, partial [candidate division KSB1 bacterium]|nr:NAD+ synthase [candidate division KSB1 bacterium]
MTNELRIALAQVNLTVGDLRGNQDKIIQSVQQAKKSNADIIAFPELSVCGYPPEDLLLKPQFIEDNKRCIEKIVPYCDNITAIIGFADRNHQLFNAAAIIHNSEWIDTYHKIELPNYEVFDEKRYFAAGNTGTVFDLNNVKFGVNICEDIWVDDSITESQVHAGDAEIIINMSSSPFHQRKNEIRKLILTDRAKSNCVFVCYVNLVGGQDELVFDGHSLIINENGNIVYRGSQFNEELIVYDIDVNSIHKARARDEIFQNKESMKYPVKNRVLKSTKQAASKSAIKNTIRGQLDSIPEIYEALVLGTRDYIRKNGFKKVVLGLSGGIDSALTACIAADALGSENVIG